MVGLQKFRELLVGAAIVVPTYHQWIPYLIVAPTMRVPGIITDPVDVMLATPMPTGPVELVRPNVMYTFADPALEARPAGQKLLIRMGPDNAAVVKDKLTQLRAIVATSPPPKH